MASANPSDAHNEEPESGVGLQALSGALLRAAGAILFRSEAETDLGGMPVAQLRCLHVVGQGEGRKMQELANELGIKLPALSQIVERLVRRALVERRADPLDRRVVRVHLTDAARVGLAQVRAVRERRLADAVRQLGPDTVPRLVADLNRLADIGEQVPGHGEDVFVDASDPVLERLKRRPRSGRLLTKP
jgi:DNA-binding MarR family transcriptional regulator